MIALIFDPNSRSAKVSHPNPVHLPDIPVPDGKLFLGIDILQIFVMDLTSYAVDTPELISRVTNKRLSLSYDEVSVSVQCIVEFVVQPLLKIL